MSGSFGSGGLGSFTVFPVELTCDLAGDSSITESVTLITQGVASFVGDSTTTFDVLLTLGTNISFAGDSSVVATAVLFAEGSVDFAGDSSTALDMLRITAGTVDFSGDSNVNFMVVAEVDITSAMSGDSTLGANLAIIDADALIFAGESTWSINTAKVFVTSQLPALLVGTAKPPVIPVIRINPPPILTPTPSIGGARRRGGTDKKPR